MDFFTHELPNGIRLIHIQTDSPVAHTGFFIHTGTRDEDPKQSGMAHFIEHLIFKGTVKRRAYHILSRLEDVGGDLNAYTTKEETCVHASFLKEYYDRTLELLSDIVFHSIFPEKAIESEKDVIIDEINSYRDSPSELIFDDFEEHLYKNHPLGRSILGTARVLKKYTRQDVLNFIGRKYCTNQMVLASAGNISSGRILYLFEKYFGHIPSNIENDTRKPFDSYQPFNLQLKRNTYQIHALIGNIGYSLQDPKRMVLHLLTNIMGGPGMNSRLNMALRERKGLSYNTETSYTPYSDTGIFTIYFSTDRNDLQKCLDEVHREIELITNKPLGIMQLKRAKQQIMGQLAISYESFENQMLSMGKSFLVYNRVDTIEELLVKIEAITGNELLEVANEIFDREKLSYLIYK